MTTIAKKLAQVKPGTVFVGIDLGLDDCTVVVWMPAASAWIASRRR
jgi:hypothetical protein